MIINNDYIFCYPYSPPADAVVIAPLKITAASVNLIQRWTIWNKEEERIEENSVTAQFGEKRELSMQCMTVITSNMTASTAKVISAAGAVFANRERDLESLRLRIGRNRRLSGWT